MIAMTMEPTFKAKAKILVVGVGDGGSRMVDYMITQKLVGVSFLVVNTDMFALEHSLAKDHIELGKDVTSGLSTGGNIDLGKAAIESSLGEFEGIFASYEIVFIVAGLGGGTGTIAAPLIAAESKRQGALTIAIISLPFSHEPSRRMRLAQECLKSMEQMADSVIVVENQKMYEVAPKSQDIRDLFTAINYQFLQTLEGITKLMTQRRSAGAIYEIIRIDFNDIRTIMHESQYASIGFGKGQKSATNCLDAVQEALKETPVGVLGIGGARGVLVSFSGNAIATDDFNEAMSLIHHTVGEDLETNIIHSITNDEDMVDTVEVMIVATGFGEKEVSCESPTIDSLETHASKETVVVNTPDYTVFSHMFEDDPAARPAILRKRAYEENGDRTPPKSRGEYAVTGWMTEVKEIELSLVEEEKEHTSLWGVV